MSKKTFDISKLRGTSLAAIKEQNEEISFSGSKKNYLSINEGTNKFRFFPAHHIPPIFWTKFNTYIFLFAPFNNMFVCFTHSTHFAYLFKFRK